MPAVDHLIAAFIRARNLVTSRTKSQSTVRAHQTLSRTAHVARLHSRS
jgi:hypothetical protein